MGDIVQRLKIYADHLDLAISNIEVNIGVANGTLAKPFKSNKGINTTTLEKFLSYYSELNPFWVIRGKGEMILSLLDQENIAKSTVLFSKIEYMEELVSLSSKEVEKNYQRELRETKKFTKKFLEMENEIKRLKNELDKNAI